MDILDREILKALLSPYSSIYELNKFLQENQKVKNPYSTINRHVKKMQKEGLISGEPIKRKDGEVDKRGSERLRLTEKGLAFLILKVGLTEMELISASDRLLESQHLKAFIEDLLGQNKYQILQKIFERIKPKVNLDFFDKEYFGSILLRSLIESADEMYPKYKERILSKEKEVKKMMRQLQKKAAPYDIELRNLMSRLEKERDSLNHVINIIHNWFRIRKIRF